MVQLTVRDKICYVKTEEILAEIIHFLFQKKEPEKVMIREVREYLMDRFYKNKTFLELRNIVNQGCSIFQQGRYLHSVDDDLYQIAQGLSNRLSLNMELR